MIDPHTLKGAGNASRARGWHERLSEIVRALIRTITIRGRNDYQPLHALMERWFDSIHTFHLPYDELTLDLVSFVAIVGIACTGDTVPFDMSLSIGSPDHVAYIKRLFVLL